jgi:hypothetical protein
VLQRSREIARRSGRSEASDAATPPRSRIACCHAFNRSAGSATLSSLRGPSPARADNERTRTVAHRHVYHRIAPDGRCRPSAKCRAAERRRQDRPRAASSHRQLALGPQPVRERIAVTLLEVDEVGTLCDLDMARPARPHPGRARADRPISRFGGHDGHLRPYGGEDGRPKNVGRRSRRHGRAGCDAPRMTPSVVADINHM